MGVGGACLFPLGAETSSGRFRGESRLIEAKPAGAHQNCERWPDRRRTVSRPGGLLWHYQVLVNKQRKGQETCVVLLLCAVSADCKRPLKLSVFRVLQMRNCESQSFPTSLQNKADDVNQYHSNNS